MSSSCGRPQLSSRTAVRPWLAGVAWVLFAGCNHDALLPDLLTSIDAALDGTSGQSSIDLTAPEDLALPDLALPDLAPRCTGALLTLAQPTLQLAQWTGSGFLVTGDIDHDGHVDVALAGGGARDGTRVLFGRGDGTFLPGANLEAAVFLNAVFSVSLALGDFDRDGLLDLVSPGSTGAAVRLSRGGRTFAPPVDVASYLADGAHGFAVGDFDEDGKLDLVMTEGLRNYIDLARGRGDGTFSPAVRTDGVLASTSFVVADVDNDKHLDVVGRTNEGEQDGLTVAFGDGHGAFPRSSSFRGNQVGCCTESAIVRDLDHDGHADLAFIPELEGGVIEVGLGDGRGGFQAGPSLPIPKGLSDFLGARDLDGKNGDDLIYSLSAGEIDVLLSKGGGQFAPPLQLLLPGLSVGRLGIADFNEDGLPDIAAAVGGTSPTPVPVFLSCR